MMAEDEEDGGAGGAEMGPAGPEPPHGHIDLEPPPEHPWGDDAPYDEDLAPESLGEEDDGWADSGSYSLEDVADTDRFAEVARGVAPVLGVLQRVAEVYNSVPMGKCVPNDYFLETFFDKNFVEVRHNIRAAKIEYRASDGLNMDWVGTDGKWVIWSDGFEAALRSHLERNYERNDGKEPKPFTYNDRQFTQALLSACHRNQVDPFLEWIEGLPQWDGKKRCETVLMDHFEGVDDTRLTRWASLYPFVGALQRSYDPGCKIDETPVLVSGQGTGKSSFVRALLRDHEWFGDSLDLSAPMKEQAESLAGRVIVEMSEMVGSSRLDIERMKAFLSRTNDGQHRAAYARSPEDHPRMCVFIGTGNDTGGGILPNDPTGNRRFVVVPLDSAKGPVEEMVEENREQLWAEARDRRANGESEFMSARLPRDLINAATKINDEYRRSDTSLEEGIDDLDGSKERTLAELAEDLDLFDGKGALDRRMQDRLARALRAKGWEKKQTRGEGGKRKRVWMNPIAGSAQEPALPESDVF